MAAFEYTALDQAGKQQRGVLEADSVRQIRQILRDRHLAPLSVEAAQDSAARGVGGWRGGGLSAFDLAMTTRQLSTLIGAGIPLEETLRAVAEQSSKRRVQGVLMAVRGKVLEGHSLAGAMQDHANAFSQLYRSTVAAGEASGHLDRVLDNLADYSERQQEFQQNIKLALIYPVVLVLVAVAIVTGLMTYVVPKIVISFQDAGTELPALTRGLIAISDFLRDYALVLIVAIVLIVLLVRWLLRQPEIRRRWHRFLLEAPGLAGMVRGANAARYASTLAIMTRSGVPLVDAMRIGAEVLDNEHLRSKAVTATQRVREGAALYTAMQEVGYFPPMMLHMINSGESSGELDNMLERVATFQQKDMERLVSMVVSIFQPVVLLIMGVVVLMIVLAMLMPIISMNNLVA